MELDNVVSQHPAVAEAVSFAIDDEMYGQDVGLAVVMKDGQTIREHELRQYIARKVAKFKVPKKVCLHVTPSLDQCYLADNKSKVFFTDHMPKTATGKVQRRMVAQEMLKKDQRKAKL